jgi:hypothetical protein
VPGGLDRLGQPGADPPTPDDDDVHFDPTSSAQGWGARGGILPMAFAPAECQSTARTGDA